ncbi:cytidylate kinase family protein [Candidatus Woesebacteria bacterium]|nr:cytidylate kinase family protein [Candidatus Woesebacteria bacterium]
MSELKFKNVAISGAVASGKGTLKHNLEKHLAPHGWHFSSGGELNRNRSGDNISPSANKVSDEYNKYIEKRTEELFVKEKHYVIEAWLAGWVARDMTDTLRVLLVCSNPAVTIDRVVNRDKVTVTQAKEILRERMLLNEQTWKRLYGDHDFQDPKHFQLVIDTYTNNREEVVQKVLDALGYNFS